MCPAGEGGRRRRLWPGTILMRWRGLPIRLTTLPAGPYQIMFPVSTSSIAVDLEDCHVVVDGGSNREHPRVTRIPGPSWRGSSMVTFVTSGSMRVTRGAPRTPPRTGCRTPDLARAAADGPEGRASHQSSRPKFPLCQRL